VKAVETLIHQQTNVADIVFFILWNISFLLILALDLKYAKKVLSRHGCADVVAFTFAA